MDESSPLLDAKEKEVLTIALSVLGLLALGAFFLVLLDPMLFAYDDEDDEDYYKEPSWAIKQIQLHQAKFAQEVYPQQPIQAYQPQQRPLQIAPTVPPSPPPRQPRPVPSPVRPEHRDPPTPPPPPPPRPPPPPPKPLTAPSPKQVYSQGTQTTPIKRAIGVQTDPEQPPEAEPTIVVPKEPSFRTPESLQLAPPIAIPSSDRSTGDVSSTSRSEAKSDVGSLRSKSSKSSKFSSYSSRKSGSMASEPVGDSRDQDQTALVVRDQSSPAPGIVNSLSSPEQQQLAVYQDSHEIVEAVPPDEFDNDEQEASVSNQQLSNNNMMTIYEAPETVSESPTVSSKGREVSSQGDRSEQESEVEISPYTPIESGFFSLPDELQDFTAAVDGRPPTTPMSDEGEVSSHNSAGVLLPTTPPSPPNPLPVTQVTLKTLIPRYSHKAERQRFIILNGLILIITSSIVSVVVIQLYV